ncbi:hypothetical protein U9M48_004505 [Paspalum notatum var. saurae]|uniref:Uncharacterized protein n=1 Tax=Paspalum notatum var. saurae TaxID=547442 RepID=A0AAQ3PV88_PASNO
MGRCAATAAPGAALAGSGGAQLRPGFAPRGAPSPAPAAAAPVVTAAGRRVPLWSRVQQWLAVLAFAGLVPDLLLCPWPLCSTVTGTMVILASCAAGSIFLACIWPSGAMDGLSNFPNGLLSGALSTLAPNLFLVIFWIAYPIQYILPRLFLKKNEGSTEGSELD